MKPIMMSFSLGLILSTLLIGIVYWIEAESHAEAGSANESNDAQLEQEDTLTEDDAKSYLKEQGYVILSEDEYDKLANLESENQKLEEDVSELEGSSQDGQASIAGFELVIETGMGLDEVALQLQEQGVIDDETRLKEFFRENGYSRSIQTGSFIITTNMSLEQIAITITN